MAVTISTCSECGSATTQDTGSPHQAATSQHEEILLAISAIIKSQEDMLRATLEAKQLIAAAERITIQLQMLYTVTREMSRKVSAIEKALEPKPKKQGNLRRWILGSATTQ